MAKKAVDTGGPGAKSPKLAEMRAYLQEQADRLGAELKAAREVHDRKVNDPELIAARKKIKEISAQLGPIQNDLAALARVGGSAGLAAEPGKFERPA